MNHTDLRTKVMQWEDTLRSVPSPREEAHRYYKALEEAVGMIKRLTDTPLRDEHVCNWRGLATRFIAAIHKAGGPEKSSETFSVIFHPPGDVAVEMGTYSIAGWPRLTEVHGETVGERAKYCIQANEREAFLKAERKVFEAEQAVEKAGVQR